MRALYTILSLWWLAWVILLPTDAAEQPAVEVVPLTNSVCSGAFTSIDLPHITRTNQHLVWYYESNGAGVAMNDLNQDNLLDIVLTNLDGTSTLLWNQGGMRFLPQLLETGAARGVQLVDVDGDGWLDMVLTHSLTPPTYWRNQQAPAWSYPEFKRMPLPGMKHAAYTLLWGDPDGDGDLDMVTGSYNSELEMKLRDTFLFGTGAGVFYYERVNKNEFKATRLAETAQALALWWGDLDADGRTDLLVGNDFTEPDRAWILNAGIWQPSAPFEQTTLSTMSFDAGDINNDGQLDFFAADMQPYSTAPEIRAIWQPVLERLAQSPRLPADRQIIANVLQLALAQGGYRNVAQEFGVAATGWSWSSRLGDLDQDGWLDLAVVNGMIANDIFSELPDAELVEANQVFHNAGGEYFVPAPDWGLDSPRSGRGMTLGDLDNDGDLDMVVNNLRSAAQLFENQLCSGASLQVALAWCSAQNTHGLDSVLTLSTSTGTYTRRMSAGGGYLAGDPARVHFGLPAGSRPQQLDIRWSDGSVTRMDDLTPNTLITITRSTQGLSCP